MNRWSSMTRALSGCSGRPGSGSPVPSARAVFDAVNRLCGSVRRPMLVDMASTMSVAREVRAVFGEPSAASRIAVLGRSPVDRVIANFTLGVSRVPCRTRFFTDRERALAFLREGRSDAAG